MRLTQVLIAMLVLGCRMVRGTVYLECDVVVVGAGYAGLSAATRLKEEHNLNVIVVEASNSSGGRTKNYNLQNGHFGPDQVSTQVVELGGQWIGNATVQSHAWELIVEDLGFNVSDASYTHGGGNSVLVASDGRHNFTSMSEMLRSFPKHVSEEVRSALGKLDAMAATIDLATPWESPRAREWDSMTFTSWINETCTLQESRTVLQIFCTTLIAQSADVVSFLHILFYIRAANGIANLQIYEQQYRVVGGTQAPCIKMADSLDVLYDAPVTLIQQFKTNNTVSLTTIGRAERDASYVVNAKYAIVTGAPPIVNRFIEFDPPLPYAKRQLFERLPLGNSVKAQLVYKTPFWRKSGWSGTVVASVPAFDSARPLLSNCLDNTPDEGFPGVLLCFLEGDTSVYMMENMTHEERRTYITKWLAESFGPEALDSDFLLDYNWAAQPFIGGAYSSYFPTGVWRQMGSALRSPYGNIFWAGADYAEEGFGYINGAVESGKRAVRGIVERMRGA